MFFLIFFIWQPRATFHFPIGQVSVEERTNEDDEKALSVYGIGKSDFLDGVLTAQYNENDLNLQYCYKVSYLILFFILIFLDSLLSLILFMRFLWQDNELTLVPSVSLPSNAVSVDFKRRFGPSDKLR